MIESYFGGNTTYAFRFPTLDVYGQITADNSLVFVPGRFEDRQELVNDERNNAKPDATVMCKGMILVKELDLGNNRFIRPGVTVIIPAGVFGTAQLDLVVVRIVHRIDFSSVGYEVYVA